MSVSRSLRFHILERDNHTCHYCGRRPPEVVLQVDHVVSIALGGSDTPDNLITACRDCNTGKGARVRINRADIERATAQVVADAVHNTAAREADAFDVADLMGTWTDTFSEYARRPSGESLSRYRASIGTNEVLDAIQITERHFRGYGGASSGAINYFHGVCRNKERAASNALDPTILLAYIKREVKRRNSGRNLLDDETPVDIWDIPEFHEFDEAWVFAQMDRFRSQGVVEWASDEPDDFRIQLVAA